MYGLHSLRSGGATSGVSHNPILSESYLNFMDAGSRILQRICKSKKTSLSVYK